MCVYLDSGPKLCVRQADGLFAARSPETLCRGRSVLFSPVSLGHFLDVSSLGPECGHWGPGLGGQLDWFWKIIDVASPYERIGPPLPSQLLPCEGKVFISPQPNTRIRLKAALSTCVCCRPVRPVIACNSPRQVSVDATDAHDARKLIVVKLRN